MNKTASRTALTALLTTLLGAIIITATISSCYASTFSGDVITFTDLPSTIKIDPGSQASFDVTLRNSGSIYGDVDILTRSLPDGIMVVDNDCTKLVDMGKSVTYHITIAASNDMEPGTCHFEIADRSDVDRHTGRQSRYASEAEALWQLPESLRRAGVRGGLRGSESLRWYLPCCWHAI